MRRIKQLVLVVTIASLFGIMTLSLYFQAAAATANAPSLVISQLKITSSNGQFVTLYNPTNTAQDMSRYQLEYFNSYDLTKATSSKLISLTGVVPPHGYFMVNDSAMMLCYQLTVDSVSLGLSSTAGMFQLLAYNQTTPGGAVTPVLQDYVGWSKTAAAGAQTLPSNTNAFLLRQPTDSQNNPLISQSGAGTWQTVQPASANACDLISTTLIPVAITSGLTQLLPASEPPATLVAVTGESEAQPSQAQLPTTDIGLMAPQITELLPNPIGTGNDSTDEYIELYNANNVSFDLSGFQLQSGLTSLHTYTFPGGTMLPPHSFVAFYAEVTKLSLSNTSGQIKLLDPTGNSISASDVYANAKDGQAWALAKGKWYWTINPTPNAANIIKLPPVKNSKAAGTKTKKPKVSIAKVKGAKSAKTALPSSNYDEEASSTPIHTRTLAIIVGLALLYGAYEYRQDMANRIHQFRNYFKARSRDRL